jgi:hypothetical protein
VTLGAHLAHVPKRKPHTLFTTEIADLPVEVDDNCVYMAKRQAGACIAPPVPVSEKF